MSGSDRWRPRCVHISFCNAPPTEFVAELAFYCNVSKTIFRGRTPKIIVHIPRNPCLWGEGGDGKTFLLSMETTPTFLTCRTKILAIFQGTFKVFFEVFESRYVFIPLFLSELLWTCEILRFRETFYSNVF
jgi:hypothetical protein